ncbi:MAG: hypothetical protein Solumvirus5_29 [Solumvirus sp.]|uniref:Uncharacterized protein n=1 Tax=Solumvirus sp. TaxID=2487773 RepID=A0A3G5AGQ2_9VIRU|nr:MAG: hypothetical protein Solumvirus5_29 [Solumvirus sp.]
MTRYRNRSKKSRNIVTLKKLEKAISHFRKSQRKDTVKNEIMTVTDSSYLKTSQTSIQDTKCTSTSVSYTPIIYNNGKDIEIKVVDADYTIDKNVVNLNLILQVNNDHKWNIIRSIYLSLPVKSRDYDIHPGITKDRSSLMICNHDIPPGKSEISIKKSYYGS